MLGQREVALLLAQLLAALALATADAPSDDAADAGADSDANAEDAAEGAGEGAPEEEIDHFAKVNVFDGLDWTHAAGLVAGALLLGAYYAAQWKKDQAEAALAKSMMGGLGLAEDEDEVDGDVQIDKKTGQMIKEGVEVMKSNSASGAGTDTEVDLSGSDPEVADAWEKFQAAARTQDYKANVPIMEKAVAIFEAHLPASHQASMQSYVHLARNYQQVQSWDKADKLCARACEKLDTTSAGGPVKQTLITLCCAEGMSCFRTKKGRNQHGENCYRRALKVVREMSHQSWRPVELNTIHEFARELLG